MANGLAIMIIQAVTKISICKAYHSLVLDRILLSTDSQPVAAWPLVLRRELPQLLYKSKPGVFILISV